jgi:hypothetical protein
MKKAIVLAAAFLSLQTAAIQAADDWAKLLQKRIDLMNEVTKILKTVKDKETSKAAVAKLKKWKVKFVALAKESQKMAKPSKEKSEELKKKYGSKIGDATKALLKEHERIKDVPGGEGVLGILELKAKPKK